MTLPATLEDIFLAALDRPPADRSAFLADACAGDPDQLARVLELLAAHDQSRGPLDTPRAAGPTADLPATADPLGTAIGPYKLVEIIGEGGMGTVYLAQQHEPVRRLVALKVIRTGMDTAQVVARFEAERQALALMDHPNIAKVLDAGATPEGRPYFVMELVKGVPITRYCDDHHLTPRERLELFVPVCQAVQHAHQKGIIHRDLKPSNVLVAPYDGRPVPKVIDFGVAKAAGQALTEKTLVTGLGAVVGTLEYMSPEQAELNNLDVDTRSDVYSLGVLLYELLTGTTPLSGGRLKRAALLEALRMVREEEPPTPSRRLSDSGEALASISAQRHTEPARLTKMVRGELDWIVMKALEKDRARRYETANGFAMDVQRYLADEAVQACPPSGWYRCRKFASRNKRALATTTAVAVVTMVGLASGTVLLWQEKDRTQVAYEAEAKAHATATEQRRHAEASYRLSREALEGVIRSLTEDPRLKGGPLEDLRRVVLEAEKAFYERFVDLRADEPGFQAEWGQAYMRLGHVTVELGSKEEALGHFERARAIFAELIRGHPMVHQYQADLAACTINLGNLYRATGRGGAEQAFGDALVILKVLTRDHPEVPRYQDRLAANFLNLGSLYRENGRPREAERAFLDALVVQKGLARDHPKNAPYQSQLAIAHHNLGLLYSEVGPPGGAAPAYQEALKIQEGLVRDHPAVAAYQADLARTQLNLGNLYHFQSMGRTRQAEAAYVEAVRLGEVLVRDHPLVSEYQNSLAASCNSLGNYYRATDRLAKAGPALRRAVDLRAALARDHPTVADYRSGLAGAHINLGVVYRLARQSEAAETALLAGLTVYHQLHDAYPNVPAYQANLAEAHNSLALLYQYNFDDRLGAAEDHHKKALGLREALVRDHSGVSKYVLDLGGAQGNLGNLMRESGRSKAAHDWYTTAIATLGPVFLREPQRVIAGGALRDAYWGRALVLAGLARPAEAVRDWDRAIELDGGEKRAEFRTHRAIALASAGEHVKAATEADALAAATDAGADTLYDLACAYALCAAAARADDKQAERYAARAVELLRRAVRLGYQDTEHMKQDTDLGPLRSREDFKKLLAELETKKKP